MRHFQVFAVIGCGTVHDFEDAVGVRGDPERALESLDEVVWQLADKAYRIGENDVFPVEVKFACGAVEGCEELVFHVHVGPSQTVCERGLACVRVADNADLKNVVALVRLAFAGLLDFLEFFLEFLDALTNHAAVGFELRLTRPLGADAAIVLAA